MRIVLASLRTDASVAEHVQTGLPQRPSQRVRCRRRPPPRCRWRWRRCELRLTREPPCGARGARGAGPAAHRRRSGAALGRAHVHRLPQPRRAGRRRRGRAGRRASAAAIATSWPSSSPQHHHHHLVCTECGIVTDFDPSAAARDAHRPRGRRAAGQRGFEVTHHVFDVRGRCRDCVRRVPEPVRVQCHRSGAGDGSRPRVAVTAQPVAHLGRRQRPRDEVTLHQVAAERRAARSAASSRLDALAHHLQVERLRHADHRRRSPRGPLVWSHDAGHERPVDLDGVQRVAADVGERRVAGAEVVERQATRRSRAAPSRVCSGDTWPPPARRVSVACSVISTISRSRSMPYSAEDAC